MFKRVLRKAETLLVPYEKIRQRKINKYKNSGRIPWSEGYAEYKTEVISNSIHDESLLALFRVSKIPDGFGIGIDERVVEYPWLFSQLTANQSLFLDAGSTFNFKYILDQKLLANKKIHICTFFPESPNFNEKGISYVYSDLRELPYKSFLFDEIVCQSTIEHIDMDNSIYGYSPNSDKSNQSKSFSYLKAVNELCRVLKQRGSLYFTFPFGKFENHNFFQQFDDEMVSQLEKELADKGHYTLSFARYETSGWKFAERKDCQNIESYNPHTGRGKKDDGAAHCRCICLVKFVKE